MSSNHSTAKFARTLIERVWRSVFFFPAWVMEMLGAAKGIMDKKEESKLQSSNNGKKRNHAFFGQEYRIGKCTRQFQKETTD